MSFGDEISLGNINYKDPKRTISSAVWLKAKGITKTDLGVEPIKQPHAVLNRGLTASARQACSPSSSTRRTLRRLSRHDAADQELIGPHVLTGANYSPAFMAASTNGRSISGSDIFKQQGMTMSGRRITSSACRSAADRVVELAQARCAVKYHNYPIHYYVMPHAPGQEPGSCGEIWSSRSGFGARQSTTSGSVPRNASPRNYVAWKYKDTFRVAERIDLRFRPSREVPDGGRCARPGRDPHEQGDRLQREPADGALGRRTRSRPVQERPKEITRRCAAKEQQMLYLALRHAQHAVDSLPRRTSSTHLKTWRFVYFAANGSTTAVIRS